MLDIFGRFPTPNKTINTVPYVHFCVSSISAWWIVWRFCYIKNVLFQTYLNVYQAFNGRKIKNLFMVSARFCEIYFILQVLMYIFNIC